MVVRVRFELSDTERRAIAARIGERGMAAHQDVEAYITGSVRALLDALVSEYEAEKDGQPS